jgi:integrase
MAKPKPTRAVKPRADFPLFPHQAGYWAKKVRGKLRYFGKVADDPKGQAALDKWLEQRDDLLAGRVPRVKVEGLTVRDLANKFLSSKKDLLNANEITPRTFGELHDTCKRIGDAFGWDRLVSDLVADDFDRLRRAAAKQWGPVRLGNEIQRIRCIFKFGTDSGLILEPIRYGSTFKKPSRKVLRLNRAKNGPRMLEATELRQVIDAAPVPLKAMILLGLNCGFGNTDVATLPRRAVDLKCGWINFPRPKTGIDRRCPLWPETVEAIREALASRPAPRIEKHNNLVFLTTRGNPWRICERRDRENGDVGVNLSDFIGKMFSGLLKSLKVHRPGVGFYSLRHVFETIAGDSRDQVAVDAIMGHSRNDMASAYRERIDDARLVAVTEHVRKWLLGGEETK